MWKALCFPLTVRVDIHSFQSYRKPGRRCASRQLSKLTTVNFRATQKKFGRRNWFPSNCRRWELQLSELLKTWKTLCFPLSVGFESHTFQSYLKSGRLFASRQLSVLTTVALGATLKNVKTLCFPSTFGVDNFSFQSYRKNALLPLPVAMSCFLCFLMLCFLLAVGVGNRRYANFHLSELKNAASRTTFKKKCFLYFLSTVGVGNRSFQSYLWKKFYQLALRFLVFVLIDFVVSYTEPVEDTWTKTLPNICY